MAKDRSQNTMIKIAPDRNTSSAEPSREEIAQRAYELYLARGGAGGDAVEDWFQAERELQARQP